MSCILNLREAVVVVEVEVNKRALEARLDPPILCHHTLTPG